LPSAAERIRGEFLREIQNLRQIKALKESRFGQIEFLNLKNSPLIDARSLCGFWQIAELYTR
jgi:hypothetical protein